MIRSSSRERERGYVLISVMVIAVLYFALIMLVLWESSEKLRLAQRFRARLVAQTLAESAAELAARGMAGGSTSSVEEEIDSGFLRASSTLGAADSEGRREFTVKAEGVSKGSQSATATVDVWGYVVGKQVVITRTVHSQ